MSKNRATAWQLTIDNVLNHYCFLLSFPSIPIERQLHCRSASLLNCKFDCDGRRNFKFRRTRGMQQDGRIKLLPEK